MSSDNITVHGTAQDDTVRIDILDQGKPLSSEILDLKDMATRDCLMRLGWLPPDLVQRLIVLLDHAVQKAEGDTPELTEAREFLKAAQQSRRPAPGNTAH